MKKKSLLLLVTLAGLTLSVNPVNAQSLSEESLMIYCGAGMQKPFQEIADAFGKKTDCEVNVTYANAAQIQT